MINLPRIQQSFISQHHRWLFHTAAETPSSLIRALQQRLIHIPADEWTERLNFGGVYVNGVPVSQDVQLPVPCKVEYYEMKIPLAEVASAFPAFDPRWIVYQDQYLVVCFKPAGLACMPAKEQNKYSLKSYLEKHLQCTVHLPSRLDFSTAGLLVLSKHADTHNSLQRLFTNRLIRKYYLCLVSKAPAWKNCFMKSKIGRHDEHPVLRRVVYALGKDAETQFKKIALLKNGRTLLEAQPFTGRTHQIRVHSRALGLPLVGDNFYDGELADNLCLLSHRLSLPHPFTQKIIKVTLPQYLAPSWVQDFDLKQIAGANSLL